MNREIKLRAWWSKGDRMLDVRCLDYGGWELSATNYDGFYHLDDVELMQYTGLKDKNGTEIYEGDIVIYSFDMMSTPIRQEVKYYEGRFIPLVRVEEGYNAIDKYNKEMFEVIGNKFENPELLDQ